MTRNTIARMRKMTDSELIELDVIVNRMATIAISGIVMIITTVLLVVVTG